MMRTECEHGGCPCEHCNKYSRAACDNFDSACRDWWQWFGVEWRRVTGLFREVAR